MLSPFHGDGREVYHRCSRRVIYPHDTGTRPGAQEELKKYPQVEDLGRIDDPKSRFIETSGVIMNLDLVVCCDSSIGHLAGALGRPCRLLVAFSHDPQWQWRRNDTPLYPQHRLWRQSHLDEWDEPVWKLRDELEFLAKRKLTQ